MVSSLNGTVWHDQWLPLHFRFRWMYLHSECVNVWSVYPPCNILLWTMVVIRSRLGFQLFFDHCFNAGSVAPPVQLFTYTLNAIPSMVQLFSSAYLGLCWNVSSFKLDDRALYSNTTLKSILAQFNIIVHALIVGKPIYWCFLHMLRPFSTECANAIVTIPSLTGGSLWRSRVLR